MEWSDKSDKYKSRNSQEFDWGNFDDFQQVMASLSKQRKTKLKLPKTPLPICELGIRTEATLSQTDYQHADAILNWSNPRILEYKTG